MPVERNPNDPPFVDPVHFLEKPFTTLEVGLLPENPSIEFLKWLTTLPVESGLVYISPKWAVIKASSLGVPSFLMPKYADILIHSHTESPEFFLPSPQDFGNSSLTARNLIVSVGGITEYHGRDDIDHKSAYDIAEKLYRQDPSQDLVNLSYNFMTSLGLDYQFTPWEEFDQQSLDKFLYEGIQT